MKQKTEWEVSDVNNNNQRRWITRENPLEFYIGYSCDLRWVNCYGALILTPFRSKRQGPILGDE